MTAVMSPAIPTSDSVKSLCRGDSAGVAKIKPEFVVENHVRSLAIDCVSASDKRKLAEINSDDEDNSSRKKHKNEKKKMFKGQNKSRGPTFKQSKENTLCPILVDVKKGDPTPVCHYDNCKFIHDVQSYLSCKPPDLGPQCHVFDLKGHCPRGVTCRYGKSHISEDGFNIINETLQAEWNAKSKTSTTQNFTKELQRALQKRTYNFEKSERIISAVKDGKIDLPSKASESEKNVETTKNCEMKTNNGEKCMISTESNLESMSQSEQEADVSVGSKEQLGPVSDTDLIKLRPAEKKKIDWTDKLYLSPLTTVGNLPFRRICKEFGADITCGEMALATSLLQGRKQEWALAKRHESEDLFGAQICGSNMNTMTRCAQVLQENANIDFVDINLGCPIDLIFQKGAGSGLLRQEKILKSVVVSMNQVLDIPLTVKVRTGIHKDKKIADQLVPKFRDWGVSLITLHGRTREQRYTRSADWGYIEKCAQLCKPVPLFGNGDILSFSDYNTAREICPSIAGTMIGRGALIKPWIFTEIKEQRDWDISSSERFDIIKKYSNYGLEHWGSDTQGVENTRKFLLEWLSFFHRYIPYGLLENPPHQINQRPPMFKGRDDLETLLASPNCADWIRITEMLLGKVPDGFNFLPKHKANSWK
nr:PREDICTED: tRNA-dihydrouridine(47) synthase [NAD(P)(+)]-like [Bemisia tabaci]